MASRRRRSANKRQRFDEDERDAQVKNPFEAPSSEDEKSEEKEERQRPRRRLPPKRYVEDAVSDEEEEEVEEEEGEEDPSDEEEPHLPAQRGSKYDEDEDFDPGSKTSEDEDDDNFGEEDTDDDWDICRWNDAGSRLFKKEGKLNKFKCLTESQELYKYWIYFVNFLKSRNVGDPLKSKASDLSEFLSMLSEARVQQGLLQEIKDFLYDNFTSVFGKGYSKTSVKVPSLSSKSRKRKHVSHSLMSGSAKLSHYIQFAANSDTNPFSANANVILQYLFRCVIDYDSGNGNFYKEVKSHLDILEKYHVLSGLQSMRPVEDLLRALRLVDVGMNSSTDATVDGIILRLTPSFKFWKYCQSYSRFWSEKEVHHSFEKIIDGQTTVDDLASFFGVTPEMIVTNLYKYSLSARRDTTTLWPLNLYLREFRKATIDTFWNESSVIKLIDKVRCRSVDSDEGAYLLGVKKSELLTIVGPLKEPDIKDTKPVKRENLDIQVQAAIPTDGLSEYEIIRRKNIEDRLALFRTCGFESLKSSNVSDRDKKQVSRNKGSQLPLREKSVRVKTLKNRLKEEKRSTKTLANGIPICVPPVDGLPLNDFLNANVDYLDGERFITRINQCLVIPEKEGDDVKKEHPHSIPREGSCITYITPGTLNCLDIYPGDLIPLIVGGDNTGIIGLWLGDQLFQKSRSVSYQVHSSGVTSVKFWESKKVVSSSLDGFIRILDFENETLKIGYQWSRNVEFDYNKGKLQIGIVDMSFDSLNNNFLLAREDSFIGRGDFREDSSRWSTLFSEKDSSVVGLTSVTDESHFGVVTSSSVKIYDARQTCSSIREIVHEDFKSVIHAEFSPCQKRILVQDSDSIKLFDVSTGSYITKVQALASEKSAPTVCWHPGKDNYVFGIRSNKGSQIGCSTYCSGFYIEEDQVDDVKVEGIAQEFYSLKSNPESPSILAIYNGHGRGMLTVHVL